MKHGKVLRRLTALALSAAMAASVGFAANPAENVTLDKSASGWEGDQTTVTLSIGATQTKTAADVVFVLDKSTSTDVKDEALRMLGELQEEGERRDLDIKVGAVIFNKSADNEGYVVDLKPLNESSVAELTEVFEKPLSSGTNIEAGIRKGMEMLDDDTSIPDDDKHLVLVTDGVTYLWGTEEPKTTYSELANTTATGTDYLNTDYHYRDDDYDAYSDAKQWMADNEKGILATLKYEVSCQFNEQGNIISTNYASVIQNKFIDLAEQGLNYKQILLQVYGASNIDKMTCNTGSGDGCNSTGSTGPYSGWKQADPAWGSITIGNTNKTIAGVGCLATSVSMLIAKSGVATTVDGDFNPGTFVQKLNATGGFSGANLIWAAVSNAAPNFVFQTKITLAGQSQSQKLETIRNLVNQGYYVVVEVKGNTGQHWVAVDGVDGNTILMMDPASQSTNMWNQYNWQNTSELAYFAVTQ